MAGTGLLETLTEKRSHGEVSFFMKRLLLKKKGFTILELLAAAALGGMVLLGVYRTLSSGIELYSWLFDNRPEMETVIAQENMAMDLRNVSFIGEGSFLGRPGLMSFFLRGEPAEETERTVIRRLEYVFESNALIRRVYDLGSTEVAEERVLVGNLERGSFGYGLDEDLQRGNIEFRDTCERVPAAVRVKFLLAADEEEILYVIEVPSVSMM